MIEFIFVFLGIFTGYCLITYSVFLLYLNRVDVLRFIFGIYSKFSK